MVQVCDIVVREYLPHDAIEWQHGGTKSNAPKTLERNKTRMSRLSLRDIFLKYRKSLE
jgi:hypothetical protein